MKVRVVGGEYYQDTLITSNDYASKLTERRVNINRIRGS